MTFTDNLIAAMGDANVVVIGDTVSCHPPALLDWLRRTGVPSVLLSAARSGDAVHRFAGRFFSCSPADKARLVRRLKEQGNRVAFLGFGGDDQWGMMCADVRIDCPKLLANFGILPA